MSKRREIERRLHSLGEIEEIINAMKNLALMETHKLTRFLATQRRVVAGIRSATEDFQSFHPDLLNAEEPARDVYLLIGSERGFCGDFNEVIVRALPQDELRDGEAALITVGRKLAARMRDSSRLVARLEGASALEQVEAVLLNLMETLETWRSTQAPPRAFRLTVFHHGAEDAGVSVTRLDPLGRQSPGAARSGHPPLLYLEPRHFLARIVEHYLFAALHEIFYGSLMAENRQRLQHMDYAVRRIEEMFRLLTLKRNSLRQEEITEEIEVIMLSVEAARPVT